MGRLYRNRGVRDRERKRMLRYIEIEVGETDRSGERETELEREGGGLRDRERRGGDRLEQRKTEYRQTQHYYSGGVARAHVSTTHTRAG